jgi:DNA-binding transcriptional ArsR family regulator
MSNPQLSGHDLALVEAVAQRVLELLGERETPQPGRSPLVSAGQLAEALGVARDTVYRHAEELGAVRLGPDGPRSEHGGRRLRFDIDQAIAAWSARQAGEESQTPDPPATAGGSSRSRRRGSASRVPLLPVNGQNGVRSRK